MGPAMNLLLAFVLTAVVLYQGAEVPAYEDQPVVVGAVTASSPAAKAGIQPRRPHRRGRPTAASTPGTSSTWRSGRVPNREIAIELVRDGSELTAHG